ncbi:biliverdin-producing heme oxygenase [Asaia prunellae]|uniref:biliverdin-producing heme oxygenase n=1 Tax=Asaia prunellae TaxID=610245 RepID=UPI000A4803B8|nr:biliverdin-producing heme oxygenase [Asaia prunellae]
MLRSRVHRAHEELDTLIGALETSRDYRRYLRGMAAFRLAAESATDAAFFPSWLKGWRPVSTRVALEKDLATLKLAPLFMSAIAPPDTESALLGMLYTLEGSALGARLIAKRAALLGFTEAHGASHLAVQTGTPGNWRAFLDLLEDAPVFEAEEAGRAASSLFGFAYNAMILVDRAGDEVHG